MFYNASLKHKQKTIKNTFNPHVVFLVHSAVFAGCCRILLAELLIILLEGP